MKNKHIEGQLILSRTAMKDTSIKQYEVQDAIYNHNLGLIMYIEGKDWYRGKIPVHAVYATLQDAEVERIMADDVMKTSEALKGFLEAETITKLGLRGEILLKIEDTETPKASMAKIIVRDGQVSYQCTNYVWSESVTV